MQLKQLLPAIGGTAERTDDTLTGKLKALAEQGFPANLSHDGNDWIYKGSPLQNAEEKHRTIHIDEYDDTMHFIVCVSGGLCGCISGIALITP